MPGNGVGDRVHNFFAQENLSQGSRSQAVDGNWPLNDSLWVGSQKQFGVSDSSIRNYNLQQSGTERGHGSQRVADPHLFDITQNTEFAKSLSHHEQPNSNGYMFERQNFQARPDEANIMGVNTEYGRNNVNQRGFPFYESKQDEETPKNSFRSETSETHGSFDLFGGQHQTNSHYPGMQQQLQQQQSGFGDIQQLQHQLMLRKMQELQRQQELRQQEARQQNSLNQVPAFARQASGSQSHGLVNGTPTSDSSGYAWSELAPGNINWLQRASPAMQGSVTGLAFSPEQGQSHHPMGFSHQQVDQSLYGVPVSSSRGQQNQYAHIATERTSIQQLPKYANSFPGNHYAAAPEQVMLQDGALVGRQGHPSKSLFGNTSGQGPNSGIRMEHIQQLEAPQNTSVQESHAAQDLNGPAASLDPDEEKILFGSDDSIWDAFGSSKHTGGVSSLLDDKEIASGLPSLQSGSWSALMQSAVAEAASGGVGVHEEWPDLNLQNPDLSSGQHPSTHGKLQTALGDINLQNSPGLNSESVLADGTNMNDERHGNMGFQHHGKNNPYDHERLNTNYSKQMNQHSSGGSNWLNRGALQKADAEDSAVHKSAKGMLGHWASQQYGTTQPNNKQNHWKTNESVPSSANTGFNINENANSLQQQSQSNDWKRVMHDETGQGGGISGVNTLFHQREPVSRGLSIPNLSNLQGANHHPNQFSPNNNFTHWKHVDSSVKSKGSENSGKSQRLPSKGPQVSESSFNSSDKEDLRTHEMESSSRTRRENSNDSYRSSSSQHPNTVGQRDKFFTDAGDSKSVPGQKQTFSSQAGRRTSGPLKFQYHPMGNLEEDIGVPYGTRQGTNTNAMSLQHPQGLGGHDQGNFGHAKPSSQGNVRELEGVSKGSDDMRFKGMIPRHVPNIFASHDRSAGLSTSDKASQPSQHMLELLHKVDQSRDRGIARQLNSSERNLSSEIAEPENSDGSFGGHQRSQSSNSQGIGLQLGPPSQRLPLHNNASPRVMQTGKTDSSNQVQAYANSRGNGHGELSAFPPFQEASHGEFKNDRMGQSAIETTGHKMIGARGQVSTNHFGKESFDGHNSQMRQTNETHGRSLSSGLHDNAASSERVQAAQPPTGDNLRATQPRANPGMSQQGTFPKMLPNAWKNLPPQQLMSATQARKGQPSFSSLHQLNIVESNSLGQQNLEEQEAEKRRNSLSKYGSKESPSQNPSFEKIDATQTANQPGVNDSTSTPFSDAPSPNPSDLEAFGRSLKSNNVNQRYSLLNQMKAMKNTDNDLNNTSLKRSKDSDNLLGGQQVAPWSASAQPREQNNRVGDSSICHTTVLPGDSETPRLTGPTENVASLPANALSKEVVASDPAVAQSSVKTEHSHISPQMAPSWFEQYGTFRSGQMPQRADAVKTLKQPLSVGRVSGSLEIPDLKEQASAAADTSQSVVISKTTVPSSMVAEQLSTPLQPNIGAQDLVTLGSKKRKLSTAELHPWSKEVSGASKNRQGICAASMEWCRATNRLMEKVDNDGEVIEDVLPVPRPKRRIILTTHLMQQLFSPPPVKFLSADANSVYESVAFYAARLGLADACNIVSSARSHSSVSDSGPNSLSDQSRVSWRKVVDDCMNKANMLENEFSRLDKKASILDLRVESQDVEKFSIMNRFVKFHGRGQADGEASLTDAQKPVPQRYVTAVQLPKNLPERVQCLSL